MNMSLDSDSTLIGPGPSMVALYSYPTHIPVNNNTNFHIYKKYSIVTLFYSKNINFSININILY